jgi:hypothetical protein
MKSLKKPIKVTIRVSVILLAAIGLLTIVVLIATASCSSSFANVPAGYTGKLLTPRGWDPRILEPGQVNLGTLGSGGRGNSLVLLEGTLTTVREKFQEASANADKVDDRVLTKDGVPLTLTVYIRLTAPEDIQTRNAIFAQMTPNISKDRVSIIMLQDVYNKFAAMDVRNKIRAIVASYNDYKSLYADFYGANERINQAVKDVFKDNDVPLAFQNAGISNAKPDQKVWDAENDKVAAQARADAMNIMSEAIKADPNNLITLKWQYMQKIAEVSAESGTRIIIITDTSNPEMSPQLPVAISSGLNGQ